MMGEDIKWLIGLAVSLGETFTVALIATFRSLSASIKSGDDQLHDRVNRICDEYVKRVDSDDHVRQLRDGMKDMQDETREGLKETNKRLDLIVAVLARNTKIE